MADSRMKLTNNQKLALRQLKLQITQKLNIKKIIIFGSVARGDAEQGSDLDVLALTKTVVSHSMKHDIYALVTNINLEYDTNISIILVDVLSWDSGVYSVLAIKDDIKRDGVVLN